MSSQWYTLAQWAYFFCSTINLGLGLIIPAHNCCLSCLRCSTCCSHGASMFIILSWMARVIINWSSAPPCLGSFVIRFSVYPGATIAWYTAIRCTINLSLVSLWSQPWYASCIFWNTQMRQNASHRRKRRTSPLSSRQVWSCSPWALACGISTTFSVDTWQIGNFPWDGLGRSCLKVGLSFLSYMRLSVILRSLNFKDILGGMFWPALGRTICILASNVSQYGSYPRSCNLTFYLSVLLKSCKYISAVSKLNTHLTIVISTLCTKDDPKNYEVQTKWGMPHVKLIRSKVQ